MKGGNEMRRLMVSLALSSVLAACSEGTTGPDGQAAFKIEVAGEGFSETFIVEVATESQAAELQSLLDTDATGVILGDLVAGDGGYNQPWSWHLDPATVHAADAAMEVCDGRPSMVEDDLQYWIGTVGSYCPWGAQVVERIR